jgi:hypothetical protein
MPASLPTNSNSIFDIGLLKPIQTSPSVPVNLLGGFGMNTQSAAPKQPTVNITMPNGGQSMTAGTASTQKQPTTTPSTVYLSIISGS